VHETRQVCTSGLQYFPSTRLRQSGRRLTDHLGSTVAITDSNGTLTSQQRYLPFGGTRTNVTTPNSPGTDFGYTGQRQLDAGMGGLMDYNARFYSPTLGRFTQPDTIIPEAANPQSWNRYSYTINNPILYNDPDGRCVPACAAALAIPPVLLIAATVAVIATVYIVVTPRNQISKDMQTIGYAMDKATTKIIHALLAKPLTPDEKKKMGMIDATEGFLKEHPDIASEVLKKAKGWLPDKSKGEADHVGEAEQWKTGLENAIDQLIGVHRSRDGEAKGAIDRAVEKGKRWIDVLKRKLRGEE